MVHIRKQVHDLTHLGIGETDAARSSRLFTDDHAPHAATGKLVVRAATQGLELLRGKRLQLEIHHWIALSFSTARARVTGAKAISAGSSREIRSLRDFSRSTSALAMTSLQLPFGTNPLLHYLEREGRPG